MWDLIVSVPDHCLSFYFKHQMDIASEIITNSLMSTNFLNTV